MYLLYCCLVFNTFQNVFFSLAFLLTVQSPKSTYIFIICTKCIQFWVDERKIVQSGTRTPTHRYWRKQGECQCQGYIAQLEEGRNVNPEVRGSVPVKLIFLVQPKVIEKITKKCKLSIILPRHLKRNSQKDYKILRLLYQNIFYLYCIILQTFLKLFNITIKGQTCRMFQVLNRW